MLTLCSVSCSHATQTRRVREFLHTDCQTHAGYNNCTRRGPSLELLRRGASPVGPSGPSTGIQAWEQEQSSWQEVILQRKVCLTWCVQQPTLYLCKFCVRKVGSKLSISNRRSVALRCSLRGHMQPGLRTDAQSLGVHHAL